MQEKELLGYTVQDSITGFTGVAIGAVQYITGCNQILVQPRAEDGKQDFPASAWVDEQRLKLLPAIERVALNNGLTPGFDKPAPKI